MNLFTKAWVLHMQVTCRIWLLLGVIITIFSIYFSLYQIQRHQAFETSLDLVSVEQPLWNTLHGDFLRTTYYPVTGEIVEDFSQRRSDILLADHVQPSILLLLPFYGLVPRAETLMVLLCIAVGMGAIPLFRIALRRTNSELWALSFSIIYLLLPALETNTAHDIHLANFLPPLMLAAFDALDSGNEKMWWIWSLVAMGCREDIPFLLGWAMYWLAPPSKRRAAVWMFIIGSLLSVVSFKLIIPGFSGASSSYISRFVPLGYDISSEGLLSLLTNPLYWLNDLERFISYNVRLGLPVMFLYLLNPRAVLAMAPVLFLNGLSWWDSSLYPNLAHYSSSLIAWLLIGTLDGVSVLSDWLVKLKHPYNWRGLIGVAVFTSVAAAHVVTGYSPFSLNLRWPEPTGREDELTNALAIVPPNAAVSAESSLAGHLARRSTLRFFPDTRGVDWVIVDVWTGKFPFYQPISGVAETWQSFLESPEWETSYAQNGIIVLQRGQELPVNTIDAFRPPVGDANRSLRVHFGAVDEGIELLGITIALSTPKVLTFCSDWVILTTGDWQPEIAIARAQQPISGSTLRSSLFLPNVFSESGSIRDCSPLIVQENEVIETQIVVGKGGKRVPVTILEYGDWKGRIRTDADALYVTLEP